MWQRELISSIILLLIAMVILIESGRLPFGSLRSPKMGFFPFILGILLGILSLFLLVQAIKEKEKRGSSARVRSQGLKRVSMTLGSVLAFIFLLEPLGYIISTFVLMAFLLLVIGSQKWWIAILVAFISSVVSFLIFGLLLGASLPAGILGY